MWIDRKHLFHPENDVKMTLEELRRYVPIMTRARVLEIKGIPGRRAGI